MALIKCPVCGQPVSDKSQMCPHCGSPIQSFAAANDPSRYNEVPANYGDEPIRFNENPVPYNEEPIRYNENPAPYNGNPIGYNENPTPYNENHMPYNDGMPQYGQQQVEPGYRNEPQAESKKPSTLEVVLLVLFMLCSVGFTAFMAYKEIYLTAR